MFKRDCSRTRLIGSLLNIRTICKQSPGSLSTSSQASLHIPRAVRKLEFGQRESSRGSIDRKEVSINAILTSLRRPNPGALAQSKFQFANRSGYRTAQPRELIAKAQNAHFSSSLLPRDAYGCPYLFLAPMEGVGDRCFRRAISSVGGFDEAVTDFLRVPANAHVQSLARAYESQETFPIPLAAQLMGSDEVLM